MVWGGSQVVVGPGLVEVVDGGSAVVEVVVDGAPVVEVVDGGSAVVEVVVEGGSMLDVVDGGSPGPSPAQTLSLIHI